MPYCPYHNADERTQGPKYQGAAIAAKARDPHFARRHKAKLHAKTVLRVNTIPGVSCA